MKTVNSISALKAQIMKQMEAAVAETVDESFKNLHANDDSFYNSPQGYSRIRQLAESPQHDGIHSGGDTVAGGISLDTSYRYDPSGRDIQTRWDASNGQKCSQPKLIPIVVPDHIYVVTKFFSSQY